jgi:hypothetical protein
MENNMVTTKDVKSTKKNVKSTKKDIESTKIEPPTRMHTIILKEKDAAGRFMFLDVDQVIPVNLFGDACPMIMGVIDDRAYFIPLEAMNWFEQNFGVKDDSKIAKAMYEENKKKKKEYVEPVGAEFV